MRISLLSAIALAANFVSRSSALEDISESAYGISAIDTVNSERLRPLLHDIVTTSDFFRYYRLDLFGRPCLFWDDEGMCGNRACAVDTIEDEEGLPEIWRPEYLGSLSTGSAVDSEADFLDDAFGDAEMSCVKDEEALNSKPKDYCVPEDETSDGPGVYVSLVDNPERYTGYIGKHANMVWNEIYKQNCFADDDNNADIGSAISDTCVEKRVFYKVISGLHASVSIHLSQEYLDIDTGEWGPNVELYKKKVGDYPDRLSNLYFNYALVSKAVAKLRHYLEDFTFCTDAQGYDTETRRKILKIAIEADKSVPDLIDTTGLFKGNPQLKEEFRQKFVNVSRIIDCTGCDKCRLWGKLQVTGYATALKILFELPDDGLGEAIQLRRMEMVALINTFDRLSKSVATINSFRAMIANPDGLPDASEEPSISEEESKYPPKKHNKSYTADYGSEWQNAVEAIKFILRSYLDFPQNMWRIFIYHANKWWESFNGRAIVLERRRYEQYLAAQASAAAEPQPFAEELPVQNWHADEL
ncbi:endoplasmic reticulum Oxidoreductin 1-domain-containing protein [Kockiozyma suomiensis]|uniref:endoplasmic reticulum Oxidoreductin 1-domain-containing protein n=1 Tax=Kockiozyma suomiensis TaxID=1337062 RepID=UPI003343347E